MDVHKVSRNDWLVAIGALIMFVGTVGPWYGLSVKISGIMILEESVNGWHFWYFGWLTAILCIAAAAAVLLKAFPDTSFRLPSSEASIALGAGGLSLVIVLVRIVVQPDYAGLRWGIVISLLGALAVTAGGYLKNAEPAP